MQKFAGTLIKVTLVLAVVSNFVLAALFAYAGATVAAIILLVFGLLFGMINPR
ncbi:hypothetical protein BC833DRAFT_574132 [Globomyces pollinis-pini]|nr:hypothetical protein BC833DRAFT_574132 [Globomyces pollinis-pini]